MNSLVAKVYSNAKLFPDKIALSNSLESITYSELTKKVNAAHQLLIEHGVNEGDNVIACATKNFGFVYCYLAAHKMGATITPLDPETPLERLNYIKSCLGDSVVVWDSSRQRDISIKTLDELNSLASSFESALSMESPADIIFTSGTTGKPKGVILTHQNIIYAIKNINSTIKLLPDDIELIPMPLSHSFGLARLRCALYEGIEVVLHSGLSNIKQFFSTIENKKVTGLGMVAPGWSMVKLLSGDYIKKFSHQLRYIEFGSAPMALEDKKLLISLLPDTKIYMHYGMTEASRSTFIEFSNQQQYLHTVGQPSTFADIKIFGEDGAILSPGGEGEICVKGEFVAKRFIGADVSDLFFGEYYRSGDLGCFDSDGYIILSGRLKEIINVGGNKVNPIEIEEKLKDIPGVVESACISVKDPKGISGESICAVLVPQNNDVKDEIDLQFIHNYLKPLIHSYMIPGSLVWVDSLPKTNSGKIMRYDLSQSLNGGDE